MSAEKQRGQRKAQQIAPQRTSATLADVAAAVGVSINTVSRSLRAPHTVRPDLRQQINRIVDQLNYVPNRIAGGLAGSSTNIVGVVVTSLFNSEFAEIIEALQRDLARDGLQVMIANSAYDPDEELRVVRALLSWRPAALAIVGKEHHPRSVELLATAGIPVIQFWDASDARFDIDSVVGMDHRAIGRMQAAHLSTNGCRHLAFVGSVRKHDHRAQKRLAGMQAYMDQKRLGPLAVEISGENGNAELGERLVTALMARNPDIDGIVCNGDVIALGVLRGLRRMGRSVPEDVAVIGFGDSEASRCTVPELSTVRPPRAEIGRLVGRAVISRINGGDSEQHCLPAELIIRESTQKSVKPGTTRRRK
jgi:LacI family gluconate utilization system Gnt-I transcriptional repressor